MKTHWLHARRMYFLIRFNKLNTGFTLPELLVVVAIIATLAGISWSSYGGVQKSELDRLGRVQLTQAADALRLFKEDTGYWPRQGPFALAPVTNVETWNGTGYDCSDTSAGLVLRSSLPAVEVVSGSADDQGEWFNHPGNFWQLAWRPQLCANHALSRLATWNAESARGWRSSYLAPDKLAFVDIGNAFYDDGSGDITANPLRRDLYALGAGGELYPVDASYNKCVVVGACVFQWRILPYGDVAYYAAKHDFALHARPLLYFSLSSGRTRMVYMGADGRFGGLNSTDACSPNVTVDDGVDDAVACLD